MKWGMHDHPGENIWNNSHGRHTSAKYWFLQCINGAKTFCRHQQCNKDCFYRTTKTKKAVNAKQLINECFNK